MTQIGGWRLDVDAERIAWLTCDVQGTSTNVLSAAVLHELAAALDQLYALPPAGVVVNSAKANGFVAGADIKEFLNVRTPEEGYGLVRAGQAVLDQLERLPCPSVAAVHGFALGGGLELALACRYRIGADDAKLSLGLPEVLLGIHPGFGGTVRAVRLMGVRPAMELMLKGKPFKGARALAVGLLDEIVPPAELKTRAKHLLLHPPAVKAAPFVEKLLNLDAVRPFVARKAAASLGERVPREHYPAPYAILELWQRHGGAGAESYEAEARSIGMLMCTPTSRNLVRVFLLQDRLKGLGGKPPIELRHVHVVGAGVMGGDIAAWAAMRGFTRDTAGPHRGLDSAGLCARQGVLRKAPERTGSRSRGLRPHAHGRRRLRGDGCGCSDRGHRRKCRGQARLVCADRAAPQTERGIRNEHIQHQDRNIGRRTHGPGPAGRDSLLQSRGSNAAGGDRARSRHPDRGRGGCGLFRSQTRQTAAAVQKRAGFRRQSNI